MTQTFFNNDVDERRRQLYLDARSKGHLEKCFRGDFGFKINAKDSCFQSITDINVLIERCLYPLYDLGDSIIPHETERILSQFSTSKNVVELYQVVSYIFYQKNNKLLKKNFSFYIDFNPMIPDLVFSVKRLSPENIVTDGEKAMVGFIKNMFQKILQVQSYLEAQNCK